MGFSRIIGNESTKTQLTIAALAARADNRSVPHILFGGAAGCGKTSMARALAEFLEAPFIQADPASIKSTTDVLSIVEKFPLDGYDHQGKVIGAINPTILFLDEIHNIPLKGQENLGIAMEEFKLPVRIKRGASSKDLVVWVPRFCVVGATTMTGKLSKPLRDRFKMAFVFKPYSLEDSARIVLSHAEALGIQASIEAAVSIAKRSRGVGRLLVRFLEIAADHASVLGLSSIEATVVEAMFNIMGIDQEGLTKNDIRLLRALYETQGTPVGVDSLAVLLNESPNTIASEAEPFLIQKGLMFRSGRGRLLTDAGVEYLERGTTHKETHIVSAAQLMRGK